LHTKREDKNSDNLSQVMLGSLKWSGVSQLFRYGLQFFILAILARVLTPADFGIISVAMIFSNLFIVFNELGLTQAIIQAKSVENSHLVVCFWTSLSMAVLCFLAVALSSPFAADFFHSSSIKTILTLYSLKFIIDSLGFVPEAMLRRDLEFRKLAYIDIREVIVYGVISVILAVKGLGAFSIVSGYLCSSLLRSVLLWKTRAFKVTFSFNKGRFNELFRYGKHITGFRIINYFLANLDYFIVGRFFGVFELGCYTLAFNISNFPREKLSSIVNNVAFSVFSKIQDDTERMRRGYLKIITYVSIVVFPLLIGMSILAGPAVSVILTHKWDEMIMPLRVLSLGGCFFALTTFIGIIFNSSGRPELSFRFAVLALPVMVSLVIAGSRFGVTGVASGVSLYALIMNLTGQIMVSKILKMKLFDYYGALIPALTGSIIMSLGLWEYLRLQNEFFRMPDGIRLITSFIVGAVIYLSVLSVISRQIINELLKDIRRVFAV